MTLLSEMVSAYALVLGIERKTVKQYARTLREAGLLSQKGRGRGAAHASARDGAVLLLGLAASETAAGAPDAVHRYFEAASIAHPVDGLDASFEAHWPPLDLLGRPACTGSEARATWSGRTFGDVLVGLFEAAEHGELRNADSGRTFSDLHVEVSRKGPGYDACVGLTCGRHKWFVQFHRRAPETDAMTLGEVQAWHAEHGKYFHVAATFGKGTIEVLSRTVAGQFS